MKFVSLVLLFFCQLLLAATQYFCPMRCEKEKVYAKPGTCPVCHMDLEPVTQSKLEVLSSLDYRVDVTQTTSGDIQKLSFAPKMTKSGEAVKEIQKARVYITAQDLSSLDPVTLKSEGSHYVGDWKAPQPGNYIAYFTFIPASGKKQTFPLALRVEGKPGNPSPLVEGKNGAVSITGLGSIPVTAQPSRVKPGEKMVVRLKLPASVEETELVPFGVSEDTTQLAAIHEGTRGEYHATFPKSGLFKLWLPLKIKNGPLAWITRVVKVTP